MSRPKDEEKMEDLHTLKGTEQRQGVVQVDYVQQLW